MSRTKKSSKNAITAGVLITVYLVTYVVIGALSMPIPILFLLMPMIVALFAAPTYHMLLAKTKSATAIMIAAVLPSILLIATGHIPIAPLVSVPAGLLAAWVAKTGNYEDFKKNAISHLFFSLNLFGGFLPIWVMREAFLGAYSMGTGSKLLRYGKSVHAALDVTANDGRYFFVFSGRLLFNKEDSL